MKKYFTILLALILFSSCGTLGGFQSHTFDATRQEVISAIDTFYKKYPEYAIPEKWKGLDDWERRGYGFLNGTIFYFKETPEEMYYVSLTGESTLAVRAVSKGTANWFLEKDFNSKERERIVARFENEIIPKLKLKEF